MRLRFYEKGNMNITTFIFGKRQAIRSISQNMVFRHHFYVFLSVIRIGDDVRVTCPPSAKYSVRAICKEAILV